jgi:hypothetical protein
MGIPLAGSQENIVPDENQRKLPMITCPLAMFHITKPLWWEQAHHGTIVSPYTVERNDPAHLKANLTNCLSANME